MPVYQKLVRDRIPEIIESAGKTCTTRILEDPYEYAVYLSDKRLEEQKEFEQSKDPMELADLQEVIYAQGELLGYSNEKLDALKTAAKRKKKDDECGASGLADALLEIDGWAKEVHCSKKKLAAMRAQKAERNGAFKKRILLLEVTEKD